MSDDNPRQGNKLAWLLGVYVVIAFVAAIAIIAFMVPDTERLSSPAERAAARLKG
jgi:hypothetical protein